MGTRATYTFKDEHDSYHVYIHYDGYPAGAAEYFKLWLDSGFSWPLPRFEARDAAAAFIAANKTKGGGNVNMSQGPNTHGDLEYIYSVNMSKDSHLHISCYEARDTPKGGCAKGKLVDNLPAVDFIKKYHAESVEPVN